MILRLVLQRAQFQQTCEAFEKTIVPGLSIAGAIMLLLLLRGGAGLDSDGVHYISAARNLLAGRGLTLPFGSDEPVPLTHFPPGYPLLLAAAAGLFRLDPLQAAAWVDACFFAANIWLVAHIVRRATGLLTPAILAALFMGTSTAMLAVHSRAWSEPAFLLLSFSCLLLLAHFVATLRVRALVASAALGASAVSCRYAGIALLATGVFAICLLLTQPLWRKLEYCAVFLSFSTFLMSGIAIRNIAIAGSVANRKLMLHPIEPARFKALISHVSSWIVPDVTPFPFRIAVVGFTLCLLVLIARRPPSSWASPPFAAMAQVLVVFMNCYLLTLIVSIALLDVAIQFSYRILAPLFVASLISVFIYSGRLWEFRTTRFKFVGTCLLVLIASMGILRTALWFKRANDAGLGWSSPRWRRSEIIARVRSMEYDRPVYSNASPALYILTGRHVLDIPRRLVFTDGSERLTYAAEIVKMTQQLKELNGVVAYLNVYGSLSDDFGMKPISSWPSEEELQSEVPLRPIFRGRDGALYELASEE
jgi:hypothetical protein